MSNINLFLGSFFALFDKSVRQDNKFIPVKKSKKSENFIPKSNSNLPYFISSCHFFKIFFGNKINFN